MDGGGDCAASRVFEGKYRAGCGARRARQLSGGPAARKRCALSDGAHRSVGVVFVCARLVWLSAALHGAAHRQQEDRSSGEWLPAVVPGYAVWDESIRKYRLRFEPPVDLIRTGNAERDVLENTQKFTKVIEGIIRKYPEQWVWVHRRWNTRPKGEPPVYDFS